jgi:hypothetical protein
MSYPQHDQSQPTFTPHDPDAAARAADETTQLPRVQPVPVYTEPERPDWAKDPRNLVDNGYDEPYYQNPSAARNSPPHMSDRPASNGSAAPSGKGSIGNWFATGDKHVDPKTAALAPAEYDGWSISGLILAFFIPIAGLVLSIVSFAEAKKNHRRTHWTGITGFIVGALGSIAWLLYWLVVIIALVAFTNAVNSYPTYGG